MKEEFGSCNLGLRGLRTFEKPAILETEEETKVLGGK